MDLTVPDNNWNSQSMLRPEPCILAQFWHAFVTEGELYEVRCPETRRGPARLFGTAAGYFTDSESFVKSVAPITGHDAANVYVTLNPLKPELRARANNRLRSQVKATAADTDVLHRRHLLFDVDPKRPADIAATDEEVAAALQTRDAIEAYLTDVGWPVPLYRAMSGSGGALVYRVDLPNDDASTELVRVCLTATAAAFDSAVVILDQTVGNAARLTKIPGTIGAKGDHCLDLGRIWRPATAEFHPDAPTVPRALLQALAAEAPEQSLTAPIGVSGAGGWAPAQVLDGLAALGVRWEEAARPVGHPISPNCLPDQHRPPGRRLRRPHDERRLVVSVPPQSV
jgi:hypothetical protein